jgi:hypothetical protein
MWDLNTARTRLGVVPGDPAKDSMIKQAMDIVVAALENYLQRGIIFKRSVATFFHVDSQHVRLPRYPVQQVISINGVPVSPDIELHHREGIIWFHRNCYHHYASLCRDHRINIEYYGGYQVLPSDLEWAMYEMLLFIWGNMDQQTGGPAQGSGATVTQGSGEVSRVSISDFGSVSFDVGSSVSGGSSNTGSANASDIWGWLAPWAPLLQLYRSEAGVGVGIA